MDVSQFLWGIYVSTWQLNPEAEVCGRNQLSHRSLKPSAPLSLLLKVD